jgi:pimeloyl-ACP methyl ester carboxylesterase
LLRDENMTIRYSQTNTPEAKIPRNNFRQLAMKRILAIFWRIAPAPTRRFLEDRLFSPRTDPIPTSQTLILESGQRFQVQIKDKIVQCWKLGHGPSILFVHGWNGRGIQFHHFFGRLSQTGYSAVIFDAPAHGESQGQTTNGFEIAETVRALLNRDNGLEIRGIIAHSLGAASVIMALARQEYCPDAVLIAPPLRLRKILFDSFENAGIPEVIYKTLISELEDNLGYDLKKDDPHLVVKDIQSKFLIVHDREDHTVSYEVSREVSERSSNVTLHTTEGLGHKQILTDPSVIELAAGFFHRG